MRRLGYFILTVCALGVPLGGYAQDTNLLVASEEEVSTKVTTVYGVTADDYIPIQNQPSYDDLVNAKKRRGATRPAFDLPDVFFFVGGPIFILILLRVLVIFISGFEEKKKDEENHVASEHFNPD